jgi:hypothetical protein
MFGTPPQIHHRAAAAPATAHRRRLAQPDIDAAQSGREAAIRKRGVQPAHGWHCICTRCEQLRSAEAA